MEYNLLKTIVDPLGGFFMPSHTNPQLTQYPAHDFVNPGIAQTSRLYSFYVPLFSNPSHNAISKVADIGEVEQLGAGVSTDNELGDNADSVLKSAKTIKKGIEDSFQHPKFNFATIQFENSLPKIGEKRKIRDFESSRPDSSRPDSSRPPKKSRPSTKIKKEHKFDVY
jgi:hypothetical protein